MQKSTMYKGVVVPAQTIKIGKGKTKLIPIKVDRYLLHGIPIPKSIEIAARMDGIVNTAKSIINNSKNAIKSDETLLLRYMRKGKDGNILQSRVGPNSVIEHFIGKGQPYGVVAAFLHDKKLKIGWSKRLEGTCIRSGKREQREPLVFTKKDAVYIAVLRGLVDSITFRKTGVYTSANKVLPKSVVRLLPQFIERVQHYFKCNADNVIT